MPVRAISYMMAAASVADVIPCEQLQIVNTPHIGEAVNGIPKEKSREQFAAFHQLGRCILDDLPHVSARTVFVEDAPCEAIEEIESLVDQVLQDNPELSQKLERKSEKHGKDFRRYAAAHVAYQDTVAFKPAALHNDIESMILTPPEVAEPQRILSVGCQQEKVFYGLRHAVRNLMEPGDLVPTVQVFTKHVSPPYYIARGGEPTLTEYVDQTLAGADRPTRAQDQAAQRDLAHFFSEFREETI